jgi:hypothetical protein
VQVNTRNLQHGLRQIADNFNNNGSNAVGISNIKLKNIYIGKDNQLHYSNTGWMARGRPRGADALREAAQKINIPAEWVDAAVGKITTGKTIDLIHAGRPKTVAQSGELNRENAPRFCAEAITLSTGAATNRVLPNHICAAADKDWPRATVTIGGQTLVKPHANQVAELLDRLTGGDNELNLLVSKYATQDGIARFYQSLTRREVDLRAANGARLMPTLPNPQYTMSADPSGGILLTLSAGGSMTEATDLESGERVFLDESQSRMSVSFSLRITKNEVSLAEPLRYDWQAQLGQAPASAE